MMANQRSAGKQKAVVRLSNKNAEQSSEGSKEDHKQQHHLKDVLSTWTWGWPAKFQLKIVVQ